MKIISVVAWNTFREWMREKFFWVAVTLSVFLLIMSLILGQLTFAEEQKILADFGFLAIELSLLIVAAFSGSFVISKEIEKQTCLLLLSRPMSRTHFLLGKWLGLAQLTFLLFFSSSIVLWLLIQHSEHMRFFMILASLYLEAVVVLSFALMLSFFVRPIISLLASISIYFLGHWLSDLSYFALKSQSTVYIFLVD